MEIVDYSQVPNTGVNIQTFIEMFTQTCVKKCDKHRKPSWAQKGKKRKATGRIRTVDMNSSFIFTITNIL